MSPPSPHVLMTADAVGGVWVYAMTLARGLCREGCHVTLVTLGPRPSDDQVRSLRETPRLSLEVTDLALEWMDPQASDLSRAIDVLQAIARRVRPDVVQLNGYREAQADWRVPVVVAAHSCVRSWWHACRGGEPDEPRWAIYNANVAAGLAAADAWLAPTAAFRDIIARLYAPPIVGGVIWNGLDGAARSGEREPVILTAGRVWDEAKNIGVLGQVAPQLPWPVHVAGPLTSAAGDDCSAAARGLHVLGELSRDELFGAMGRASIFVSPAVYEPFGLTVLEAAQAGCALVLSDIPTFRELWDGAALFVDARDPASIGAVLAHLTRNAPLRQDLQRRARAHARRFSAQAMTDRYRAAYGALLDRTPAPAFGARGAFIEARS